MTEEVSGVGFEGRAGFFAALRMSRKTVPRICEKIEFGSLINRVTH
jgi:hypothetical protein